MSNKKRKNRQSCLTASQAKFVVGFLGESNRTNDFIKNINHLLENFSDENFTIDENLTPFYAHLRHISKIAIELAKFLEQRGLNESPNPMIGDVSRIALDILLSELERFPRQNTGEQSQEYFDKEEMSRQLRKIDSTITSSLLGILVDVHVPKQNPSDFELEFFTSMVIEAFRNSMGKLPVISESSNDFQAIAIVYQAFDYDHQDALIKRVRKMCREKRNILQIRIKALTEDPSL